MSAIVATLANRLEGDDELSSVLGMIGDTGGFIFLYSKVVLDHVVCMFVDGFCR